jgi:TonB family protein
MSLPVLLLLPLLAQDPTPAPPPATTAPAPQASPAAQGSPAADAVRVAGKDVPWPKRTKSVTPAYPPEAQAMGQRGIVIVQLLVGPDGRVVTAEVVRSVPPFDEAALSAVRQWEYEVTRVDGQPVPVHLTIPITFALRLPEITREQGVPELRQGVAPAFPAGQSPRQPPKVSAELTIDSEGQVREAAITAGDPPYTEALLQAVRTWAFLPPGGDSATMEVEATFNPTAREGQRVALRIFGLRHGGAAAAAPTSPPASPAPAAAPPAPTVATAPPDVPRPVSAPAPGAPPAAAAATRPATAEPAVVAPPSAGPATPPGAPAVEVVPGPAPAPVRPSDTASMAAGVSAVRDVALTEGVPDLTSGRRPQVPPVARMAGVTGQVEVRFVVEASGATSNVEVAGPDSLKEAARQTVTSWSFRRASTERLFLVVTIDYGGETARAVVKRQTT